MTDDFQEKVDRHNTHERIREMLNDGTFEYFWAFGEARTYFSGFRQGVKLGAFLGMLVFAVGIALLSAFNVIGI